MTDVLSGDKGRGDTFDAYWFNDLHQIRALTQEWIEDYNTRHPHSSIDEIPLKEYKELFGEEFFHETDDILTK
ncbi:MAG: integrase core domain-containing protein [Allomuricauda sp.]|jgi:putative transposase